MATGSPHKARQNANTLPTPDVREECAIKALVREPNWYMAMKVFRECHASCLDMYVAFYIIFNLLGDLCVLWYNRFALT